MHSWCQIVNANEMNTKGKIIMEKNNLEIPQIEHFSYYGLPKH